MHNASGDVLNPDASVKAFLNRPHPLRFWLRNPRERRIYQRR